MKIGVGFYNGIGNFVILTSILQLINKLTSESSIIIDEKWVGEVRDAVVLMAENCPFIDRVVNYPSEYCRDDYDEIYVSYHNNVFGLYKEVYGSKPNYDKVESWADSFLSEALYYYNEIYDKFGWNSCILPQYVPYDEKIYNEFKNEKIILISNSHLKLNIFDKKTYSRWGEVIEKLQTFYPEYVVVLLGGSTDTEWAGSIASTRSDVVNLTGTTNILETAAYIKAGKLLLTTDTGMMHIADALEIPSVALFGPTLVSKNGPLNGSCRVIRSPLSCAPCQGTIIWHICESQNLCMNAINPSLVLAAVRRIL